MSDWKTNPVIAGVATLIILAVAIFWLWPDGNRPRPPKIDYTCENNHSWTQSRALGADCPECDSPGLTPQIVTCKACKHSFEGWTCQQFGVGDFRYRATGSTEWVTNLPHLTCPGCKRKGFPSEQSIFRLGGPKQPAAADADPIAEEELN